MSTTETEGRIEDLEEAQELLEKAIYKIRSATQATSEERLAESYILPHLESWIADSRQSSYCSIKDLKSALVQAEPDPEDGIPTEPEPTIDEVMDVVEAEKKAMTEDEMTDYLRTK